LFQSDGVDIPLDLIPALEPEQDIEFGGGTGDLVAQAGACFLGMRFAIHKELNDKKATDLVISAEPGPEGPRVRLAPFQHARIAGLKRHGRELSELEVFDIETPMPDAMYLKPEMEAALVKRLVCGELSPPGIVHVTSHCEATGPATLTHSLVLGGRRGVKMVERRATVSAIQHAGRDVPPRSGPLVFINACGATNLRYDSPATIPEAFLNAGVRAVVSPLVSVHIDAASALALYFFGEFRTQSRTVATALVRARIELLKRWTSPLGLFYTAYGETGLRLDDGIGEAPLRRERMAV